MAKAVQPPPEGREHGSRIETRFRRYDRKPGTRWRQTWSVGTRFGGPGPRFHVGHKIGRIDGTHFRHGSRAQPWRDEASIAANVARCEATARSVRDGLEALHGDARTSMRSSGSNARTTIGPAARPVSTSNATRSLVRAASRRATDVASERGGERDDVDRVDEGGHHRTERSASTSTTTTRSSATPSSAAAASPTDCQPAMATHEPRREASATNASATDDPPGPPAMATDPPLGKPAWGSSGASGSATGSRRSWANVTGRRCATLTLGGYERCSSYKGTDLIVRRSARATGRLTMCLRLLVVSDPQSRSDIGPPPLPC